MQQQLQYHSRINTIWAPTHNAYIFFAVHSFIIKCPHVHFLNNYLLDPRKSRNIYAYGCCTTHAQLQQKIFNPGPGALRHRASLIRCSRNADGLFLWNRCFEMSKIRQKYKGLWFSLSNENVKIFTYIFVQSTTDPISSFYQVA